MSQNPPATTPLPGRTADEVETSKAFYQAMLPELDFTHFGSFWHIFTIAHLIAADVDAIARQYDLSTGEILVLGRLRIAQDELIRPTDVARALFLTNAAITAQLRVLTARGLVVSVADPADKRAQRLRLTPEGEKAADRSIADLASQSRFPAAFRKLPPAERQSFEDHLGIIHGELRRFFPG